MSDRWEKRTLIEEVYDHVELDEQEKYVLDLIVLGTTNIRMCWILGVSRAGLSAIIESIEEKFGTDNIADAGAVLRDQSPLNPISMAARHSETRLRVLTGARIIAPIVEGDHCGISCILADGTKVNAWIFAAEDIDLPGEIRLFRTEKHNEFVFDDQIADLLSDIHKVMGGLPTNSRQVRHMLDDVVRRAIEIIDDIDGDTDAEPAEDNEAETDNWLNPISLNPDYQREPYVFFKPAKIPKSETQIEFPAKPTETKITPVGNTFPSAFQASYQFEKQADFKFEKNTTIESPSNIQPTHDISKFLPSENTFSQLFPAEYKKDEYLEIQNKPSREKKRFAKNRPKKVIASRPVVYMKDLPDGTYLPMANKLIFDYSELFWALKDEKAESINLIQTHIQNLLGILRHRSENNSHNLKVYQVISKNYQNLFDFAFKLEHIA